MTKTLNRFDNKESILKKEDNVRPPLKWAGGKRWLVSDLFPIWGKYSDCRLVEPFCGGLGVALSLMPKHALLNDVNEHLINFYQWIKKGFRTSLNMKNDEEVFYTFRERFNELVEENKSGTKEAAALFYYLNRSGYNGLCRFNNNGMFNVPFGDYKTINYMKDFRDYKDKFSNWVFTSSDFEKINIKDNDFIYADPPYDVEFTKYSKNDFTWDDQKRLAKWLSRKSCGVVVSNQATERIIELYKGFRFKLRFIDAPRLINSTGDRTKAKEILATKNL